jgi:hypothetical protein
MLSMSYKQHWGPMWKNSSHFCAILGVGMHAVAYLFSYMLNVCTVHVISNVRG